jgi:hypothetical protein
MQTHGVRSNYVDINSRQIRLETRVSLPAYARSETQVLGTNSCDSRVPTRVIWIRLESPVVLIFPLFEGSLSVAVNMGFMWVFWAELQTNMDLIVHSLLYWANMTNDVYIEMFWLCTSCCCNILYTFCIVLFNIAAFMSFAWKSLFNFVKYYIWWNKG